MYLEKSLENRFRHYQKTFHDKKYVFAVINVQEIEYFRHTSNVLLMEVSGRLYEKHDSEISGLISPYFCRM
jgi:hypothetical protein